MWVMTGANVSKGPPSSEPIEAQRLKNAPANISATATESQREAEWLKLLSKFFMFFIASIIVCGFILLFCYIMFNFEIIIHNKISAFYYICLDIKIIYDKHDNITM